MNAVRFFIPVCVNHVDELNINIISYKLQYHNLYDSQLYSDHNVKNIVAKYNVK